jgi:hypothetical protein
VVDHLGVAGMKLNGVDIAFVRGIDGGEAGG